jgi:hypothetical protein
VNSKQYYPYRVAVDVKQSADMTFRDLSIEQQMLDGCKNPNLAQCYQYLTLRQGIWMESKRLA